MHNDQLGKRDYHIIDSKIEFETVSLKLTSTLVFIVIHLRLLLLSVDAVEHKNKCGGADNKMKQKSSNI